MTSRVRTLAALILALTAALAIAACGGDDGGGDEDPDEVLEATFSNQEAVTSGVFDVSVELSATGGEDDGSLKASIGGPFQGADGNFPSFDIDAEADLDSETQDFSGTAGLTSTGDSAFVNFQDTDYEVPAEVFQQFATSFTQLQAQTDAQAEEQGSANFLSSIGIDPTNWLTDVSNEGTEDVEGDETIHISGQADVPKLVEDIQAIAENAPEAAQQVSPADLSQLDQLADIIDTADFDIYTGADDDILRKFEADVTLKPPAGDEGSPDTVDFKFSIGFSDVNEPQEIAAPADPQPLQGLLDSLGVDPSALGGIGSALGAGAGIGSTGTTPPAAAPADPGNSASQAYLECLSTAQGQAALDQCAALLQ